MRNVCNVRDERNERNERNERDERDGVNGASREPSCIKIYIRQNITFADGVASFLRAVPSLLRAVPSLLRADLLLTARGTACLPPEGRQVYRPWDGKFTARGAVSNEPKEKSDGD